MEDIIRTLAKIIFYEARCSYLDIIFRIVFVITVLNTIQYKYGLNRTICVIMIIGNIISILISFLLICYDLMLGYYWDFGFWVLVIMYGFHLVYAHTIKLIFQCI